MKRTVILFSMILILARAAHADPTLKLEGRSDSSAEWGFVAQLLNARGYAVLEPGSKEAARYRCRIGHLSVTPVRGQGRLRVPIRIKTGRGRTTTQTINLGGSQQRWKARLQFHLFRDGRLVYSTAYCPKGLATEETSVDFRFDGYAVEWEVDTDSRQEALEAFMHQLAAAGVPPPPQAETTVDQTETLEDDSNTKRRPTRQAPPSTILVSEDNTDVILKGRIGDQFAIRVWNADRTRIVKEKTITVRQSNGARFYHHSQSAPFDLSVDIKNLQTGEAKEGIFVRYDPNG